MSDQPSPDDTSHDRTVLAEERTFSAWVRTGLASIATGLAIAKLFVDSEPRWLVRSLGALFTGVGGVAFLLGYWGYRRALQKWTKATPRVVPFWLIAALSVALLLGAMLAMLLVFLE